VSKHSGIRGQATTEMAIFGTILLLAFAGMLRWGQVMNKQQEISMLCFRKALHKAYDDYRGGGGFGAASYRMIERIRLVEPFNKYYTGRQRQQIGSGNSVFWDPDILYAEESEARSYYNIDGQEHDLGLSKDLNVWDVVTNTVTYIDNFELGRKTDSDAHVDYVKGVSAHDDYTTILKREKEDGTALENIVIHTDKEYNKDEKWTTPWE